VRDHRRVAVAVQHPGLWVDRLRDLVDAPPGGQSRADVEELPNPCLFGQEPDSPLQEPTVGPCRTGRIRCRRKQLPPRDPIDGETVLPAQQPVIDPCSVGHDDV
jgi:hypothetical protein